VDTGALVLELQEALGRVLHAAKQSSGRQDPVADYLLNRLRHQLPAHFHAHLGRGVQVPGLTQVLGPGSGLPRGLVRKPSLPIPDTEGTAVCGPGGRGYGIDPHAGASPS